MDLKKFKNESAGRSAENRRFLSSLKSKDPKWLDRHFQTLHDRVFADTDCLSCGNCCKTTSPIFYPNDIERVSSALGMRPADFVEKYLRIDEDNDHVLKSAPCPFLGEGNVCRVYNDRPKACRDYPHTNRKKMIQLLDLTYKNTMVCPAVLEIVARLREVKTKN